MERTDCVELTPCPFCGSKAYAYEIPPHKHVIPMGIPDCGGEAFVECTKCTAAVSGTDLKNAIESWNRRV